LCTASHGRARTPRPPAARSQRSGLAVASLCQPRQCVARCGLTIRPDQVRTPAAQPSAPGDAIEGGNQSTQPRLTTQASDRPALSERVPVTNGRVRFVAKYTGRCPRCGRPIVPGEWCTWRPHRRGQRERAVRLHCRGSGVLARPSPHPASVVSGAARNGQPVELRPLPSTFPPDVVTGEARDRLLAELRTTALSMFGEEAARRLDRRDDGGASARPPIGPDGTG
jgi:hypothetical protein